jgi:hypothetical protein
MKPPHPYACRMCGATSYRHVIDRDDTGALKPTGMFHCSGCSVVFTDPRAWRDGEAEPPAIASGVGPLTATDAPAEALAPSAAPDFRTYGIRLSDAQPAADAAS